MNIDDIRYLACVVGLRSDYAPTGKRLSYQSAVKKLGDRQERKLFDLYHEYNVLLRKSNGCMRRPRKDTPQVRAILKAKEEADAYAYELAKRPVTIAMLKDHGYHVFKTKDSRLIMLSVYRGEIQLCEGNYDIDELTKIDEMESVDGLGDFQHDLTSLLLNHKLTKNPEYRKAKRIQREGL